jgi:hypothetical protein
LKNRELVGQTKRQEKALSVNIILLSKKTKSYIKKGKVIMSDIIQYGRTAKVFYGKIKGETPSDGEVEFELTYYILKTAIKFEGIEADTYGIQIVRSNLAGIEISSESEIDIWTNLPEVETLASRLLDCKATPAELHDIAIDYVDEISCVEYVS